MVVATVAFCVGACLLGGAGIFLLLNLGDLRALRTLRRVRPEQVGARTGGRVALEGRTEYGPAGRRVAPVTGEDCAWFHVLLIREPSRQFSTGDYGPDHDVLLDLVSPEGFALAGPGGRVPVDPGILGHRSLEGPGVPVTTTLVHRLKAPVALPAVVPREIVDGLRKSERLTLTETRVPRGVPVFALGRMSRRGLRPSRAGLTLFTTHSRDEAIAARRDGIRLGTQMIAVFGLAGLVLAGGGVAWLSTMA